MKPQWDVFTRWVGIYNECFGLFLCTILDSAKCHLCLFLFWHKAVYLYDTVSVLYSDFCGTQGTDVG